MTANSRCPHGLTIGIDATNILHGGGMTHLKELLCEASPKKYGIETVIVWGRKATIDLLEDRFWLKKICPAEIESGALSRYFWQRYKLPKIVAASGCDLMFVPGGHHSGEFHPVVALSQNLLPFEYREMFRFGWSKMTLKMFLLRIMQSWSFRHSEGILFLTNYAKQRVLLCLGKFQAKTIIIPHGLNNRFIFKPRVQKAISSYSPERPFRLIYVSSIDQYKHQWHVVEAVSQLRQEGLPLALDLVGPAYPPALLRLKLTLGRHPNSSDYISYLGSIPYDQLHQQYAKADLGIFASSCENLPITLIETMAAGLPIACSHRGSMPEVLRESGVYFDPEKPDEIAQALRSLIVGKKLRETKSISSYKLAQEYSWKQCANQTFAFLSEIAKDFK